MQYAKQEEFMAGFFQDGPCIHLYDTSHEIKESGRRGLGLTLTWSRARGVNSGPGFSHHVQELWVRTAEPGPAFIVLWAAFLFQAEQQYF